VHREQPGRPPSPVEFFDPAPEWSCTTDSLFTPAGEIIVLRIGGEIDLLTLPMLAAALDANLDQQPDHLLVDIARVSYCCVRGLALLVSAAGDAAGQGVGYAVSGMPAWLDRICQLLFHDEMPVRYDSAAAAVTAIQARQARVLAEHPVRPGHLTAVPALPRQAQRAGRVIGVLVVDDHAFLRVGQACRRSPAPD